MEFLLAFLIGAAVLLLFVAVPLLGLAFLLDRNRLRELDRRLRKLEQAPSPAPEPQAVRETPPGRAPVAPIPLAETPAATATPQEPEPQPVPPAPGPSEIPRRREPEPVGAWAGGPFAREEARTVSPAIGADAPVAEAPRTGTSRGGIEWERWLGIRGAAILGAITLALAGLLFFQHAVQQGWFRPELRVLSGSIVGLACLVGGARLHRRYAVTGNGLVGAGAVILYGAAWSAHALYGMIAFPVAFAAMAAVTGAACFLALRQRSQLVALFAVVGGFATPLVLASAEDRPIGLFGYVLLLDAALLYMARRRGWPLLGLLGVAGTALLQGLWLFERMDPGESGIGLGVLGGFALLFAVASRGESDERGGLWSLSRVSSLGLTLLFSFTFAARAELGVHLWPLGLLLALLTGAACWMARGPGARGLPLLTGVASAAVIAVWAARSAAGELALGWELAGVLLGLALVHHVFAERGGAPSEASGSVLALLAVLVVALSVGMEPGVGPVLAVTLGLSALVARQAALGAPAAALLGAGLLAGFGQAAFQALAVEAQGQGYPGLLGLTAMAAAASGLFLAAGLVLRASPVARPAHLAAVLVALLALVGLPVHHAGTAAEVWASASILLALAAVGATGARSGIAYAATVLVAAVALLRGSQELGPVEVPASLAWGGAIVAALTLWPCALRARLGSSALAWRAAALAAPLAFVPLHALQEMRWGHDGIAWLALGLAALVGIGFLWAHRAERAAGDSAVATGATWYAAVAACLAAVAWPLEHERYWAPVGFALTGAAWAWIARARGHAPLRVVSAAVASLAAILLVFGALEPNAFARSDALLLNELTYLYLLPAAALVVALRGLVAPGDSADGVQRSLPLAVGLGAILLVFAWINLGVENAFGSGERIAFSLRRVPGRDLALSIAWALYAVVLLVLGTARRIGVLRWISLGFLLLTIGKVFLFDLGELEGLFRVASLVGLAISLLAVSLFYQRFVFRRPLSA